IAPQQVAPAVAVIVTACGDLPSEIGDSSHVTLSRLDRRPIHRIEIVLAARAVSPDDVRLAVAVEVADAFHLPGEIRHRAQIALARLDRPAIHRIQVVLAGDAVPPQDIGLPIAVEVSHAYDLPARVGHVPEIALGWLDRKA